MNDESNLLPGRRTKLLHARLENPLNKLKSWFWGKWVNGIQEEEKDFRMGKRGLTMETKQRPGPVFFHSILLHRETSLNHLSRTENSLLEHPIDTLDTRGSKQQ